MFLKWNFLTIYYRFKEYIPWWNGNVLVTLYYFSEKQLRYNIISTLSKFVSAGLIDQKKPN